jgi:hypothetical protein
MSSLSAVMDNLINAKHEEKIEYLCDVVAKLFSSKRELFIKESVTELLRSYKVLDVDFRHALIREENSRDTKIFTSQEELITALSKSKETDIIVFVERAGKYLVFNDQSEYSSFVKRMDYNRDSELNLKEHYQIILKNKNHPRNLMFACGAQIDHTIQNYITTKLQSHWKIHDNPKWNGHQLTINYIVDSEISELKIYGELVNLLQTSGMPITVFPAPTISLLDLQYLMARMNEKIDALPAPQVININAPINTLNAVNGIFNQQNNTTVKQKTKSDIAEEWVRNNPPTSQQPAGEYQTKYRSSVKQRVSMSAFSKIVEKCGYEKRTINHSYYWFKV